MNRSLVAGVLSAVVCAGLAAGGAAPAEGPPELQGCWRLVSVEVNGESREPFGGGQPRLVIKGDRVLYGGTEAARLTADPSTSPKVIDLAFRDPDGVYEGVYAVEKDTLRVCLNAKADAKDRPGKFSTQDQADWRLLVFEREKAAPEDPVEGLAAFAGVQLRADPQDKSVVVDAPIKGSPAEKAGLKKDDVVLKVGTTAAASLEATIKAVREAKPGAKLDFLVRRGGKEVTVTVAVAVFPLRYAALLE